MRAATGAARRLAARYAPRLELESPPAEPLDIPGLDDLWRATAVTSRVIAYLDHLA